MAGIPSPVSFSGTTSLQGGDAAPSGVSRSGDVRFGDVIVGSNKWLTIALAGVAIWYLHKRYHKK